MEIQRKYQVFVSSTFEDLQLERQEVMHALLELDCIPSGMELFPAANEDQWSLIKGVIDDCDYYIVIIGGRYGSIGPKGYSYTEMEYRYALEKGKPIIAFLHKNPDELPKNKTEKGVENQTKLDDFRTFAQLKMCKFWNDAKDLGSVVSRSLITVQRKHPGIGWVRGNLISSKDSEIEILKLRQEIEQLKTKQEDKVNAPVGSNKYAQGDDIINVKYSFLSSDKDDNNEQYWTHDIDLKWDEIFIYILPILIDESNDSLIKNAISKLLEEKAKVKYKRDKDLKNMSLYDFSIEETDYTTIIIQSRALGLITSGSKKLSLTTGNRSWILTPYGDEFMTQLRAVKRL